MHPSGLLIMIFSVGTVSVLFGWCLYKVQSGPADAAERLHGTGLHTPDMDEEE